MKILLAIMSTSSVVAVVTTWSFVVVCSCGLVPPSAILVEAYQPPLFSPSPLFSPRYRISTGKRTTAKNNNNYNNNKQGIFPFHASWNEHQHPSTRSGSNSQLFLSSTNSPESGKKKKKISKRVWVGRFLLGLVVFRTGYRYGVSRPEEQVLKRLLKESGSSSPRAALAAQMSSSSSPSRRVSTILLTSLVVGFLVRDVWRAIPAWAKPSLIQRALQDTKRLLGLSSSSSSSSSSASTSKSKSSSASSSSSSSSTPPSSTPDAPAISSSSGSPGADTTPGQELDEDDDDDDDDDISNFATLMRKLNGVLSVAQRRMISNHHSTMTADDDDDDDDEWNWQASLLALFGMLQQQKATATTAQVRDTVYASCGTPIMVNANSNSNSTTMNGDTASTATGTADSSSSSSSASSSASSSSDNNNNIMEGLDQWMDLADAAYNEFDDEEKPEEMTLPKYLQQRGYDLIKHDVTVLPGYLGHYVALSQDEKVALIGVKGTSTLEDMVTDMCGAAISYELPGPFIADGDNEGPMTIRAHEGILLSSRRLADQLQPLVEKLLIPQGYKIVIVGHSLGAAAAAMVAVLLQSRIPDLRPSSSSSTTSTNNILHVYAFASPPNLDLQSALACKSFVTTIVNNCDVIPRCNAGPVLVTMEVLKTINRKLLDDEEDEDDDSETSTSAEKKRKKKKKRRLGFSSAWKVLQSTTLSNTNPGWFRKLKAATKGDDNDDDDEQQVPMLMESQELEQAIDEALEKVGFNEDDEDQLYVPGKVILMYDLWEEQSKYLDKKNREPKLIDLGKMTKKNSDDDDDDAEEEEYDYSANRAVVAEPTAKVLRCFEFDGRMLEDHMAPSYKKSLRALCGQGGTTTRATTTTTS